MAVLHAPQKLVPSCVHPGEEQNVSIMIDIDVGTLLYTQRQ